MPKTYRGVPFRAVYTNDSFPGTTVTPALYVDGPDGPVARTLAALEYLVITDILLSTDTAGNLYLTHAGTVDAANLIAGVRAGANGGLAWQLDSAHSCPKAVLPQLTGTAGKATCIYRGYIERS